MVLARTMGDALIFAADFIFCWVMVDLAKFAFHGLLMYGFLFGALFLFVFVLVFCACIGLPFSPFFSCINRSLEVE